MTLPVAALAESPELADLARQAAANLTGEWIESRERLAVILNDIAIVTIRGIAGEDITTANIALEASMANLAREKRAVLLLEGRTLALRAAISLLQRLAAIGARAAGA